VQTDPSGPGGEQTKRFGVSGWEEHTDTSMLRGLRREDAKWLCPRPETAGLSYLSHSLLAMIVALDEKVRHSFT
jgi:hypothetical protein